MKTVHEIFMEIEKTLIWKIPAFTLYRYTVQPTLKIYTPGYQEMKCVYLHSGLMYGNNIDSWPVSSQQW